MTRPQVIVIKDRKRVNHILHLILSILTAGLWLPVWFFLAVINS